MGPLFDKTPAQLGLTGHTDDMIAQLRADARYQRMFSEAFPGDDAPVSITSISRALASFERTLISGNSPYDRFAFGIDDNSISNSAKRGATLFFDEKRECFHCHAGFNFTTSVDQLGKVSSVA